MKAAPLQEGAGKSVLGCDGNGLWIQRQVAEEACGWTVSVWSELLAGHRMLENPKSACPIGPFQSCTDG